MPTARKTSISLTSLLSLIFFFSGFAALFYQVAWQRLLTLYYGVGAISITLIVSVYMFGLGVGALFGGFLAERVKNKIILYFVVELLIGFFGLISLSFLDFLGQHTAGSSYLLSFFYMFLFLSLPTFLMGITLPLLTKIFNSLIRDFLDTVSFLYFINTLGAAIGAVCASYVIISFFGLDTAVYFAVVINFILAILIFRAKYIPVSKQEKKHVPELQEDQGAIFAKTAYLLVFVTGFLAIGYEIAWFRVVGVLVKTSPYAFSSILSVYLFGIALGSFTMSKYLKRHKTIDKKSLFFSLQFLIGIYVAAIFIGYYYLTKYTFLDAFTKASFYNLWHPWFKVPSFLSIEAFLRDIYSLVDVFLWPSMFMFIPTILMGASFPLISLLALSHYDKEGKTVGTVYFFNITGNVLGGIITGFLLLPYLGSEITLLVFSLIGIILGLFASSIAGKPLQLTKRIAFILMLIVSSVIFFPKGGKLYETMHFPPGDNYESYFEEGIEGIIMTYQRQESIWNYIHGMVHGVRPEPMYYYETVEAASYVPKVENALIIGFGTGSITEGTLKLNDVKKVTLVELNKALLKNLIKIPIFEKILSDDRLKIIIDDGRRFLLRTDEKFDLIQMDPLRSRTSYSNNIYSQQFFELIKQHLNPGGVYSVGFDEFRVMPKTLMSVFDYVRVYDLFTLASDTPFKRSDERMNNYVANYSSRWQERILEAGLKESTFVKDQEDLKDLVRQYPINTDWKPVTEYYLGLKVKEELFLKK